jgi:hypothetical protein
VEGLAAKPGCITDSAGSDVLELREVFDRLRETLSHFANTGGVLRTLQVLFSAESVMRPKTGGTGAGPDI